MCVMNDGTPPPSAIERWRSALAEWAIPPEILAGAPESPWALSPRTFAARADRALAAPAPTPSNRRAAEALPAGGSVLDVGAGAGAASLPLMRRASRLVAVDAAPEMLGELRARVPACVELAIVQGRWPDVASQVPVVDVVVCHHVAYNVADLDAFVLRMTERARRRVVMELTKEHPRSAQSFLWPIFHGIERPTRPTAGDAVDVIRACGLMPHVEEWTPEDLLLASDGMADVVASMRRSLCLTEERDAEIAGAVESRIVRRDGCVGLAPRPVVTVWWDAPPGGVV